MNPLDAIRKWCEASNELKRATDEMDALVDVEHAAHARLPKIECDENGDPLPDAFKDHGPRNPDWTRWAEAHDALDKAQDRVKAAVDRYNAAHEALFKLAGIEDVG